MQDKRWVIRISIPALFAVLAFNSTSTTFYLRGNLDSGAGGSPAYSRSTSTTFKAITAGGQTAPGIGNYVGIVQTKRARLASGDVSTADFSTLPSAGNTVLVFIADYPSASIASVTDNQGNTYRLAAITDAVGSAVAAIYYAENIGTPIGTFTVTVDHTGSGFYTSWSIVEVRGIKISSSLDAVATSSSNSAVSDGFIGPTRALSQAGEIAFAMLSLQTTVSNSAITIPSGYLELDSEQDTSNYAGLELAYQIMSTTTGPAATWTHDNTNQTGWATAIATFRIDDSTHMSVLGGLFQSLFEPIKPLYTLQHFHWRNDDASEAAATSATSNTPNTTIASLSKSTTKRLRVQVSNEGGTQQAYTAQQLRLEYGLKVTTCTAIASWTDVGAALGDWDMANSTFITNGANTSNIATSTGGMHDENHWFIGTGAALDTSSQTASIAIPSHSFVEVEYAIQATTAATDGATYCFRVTDAGSTSNYLYPTYAQASLSGGGGTLTLTVSTNNFTTVTPGTASFATSTLEVTATNGTGWSVYLSGDNKSTGNQNFQRTGETSVQIPDQTEWVPGAATTSAGNAVRIGSLAGSGSVAAFRLMSASGTAAFRSTSWWGTTDAYIDSATSLWSGIPSSTVNRAIGNSSISGSGALNTVIYYLNPPATQKTGAYTAPLTYTVVDNP